MQASETSTGTAGPFSQFVGDHYGSSDINGLLSSHDAAPKH
jgi:hypothetical protein